MLSARRVSPNPRSRILNVYDRTGSEQSAHNEKLISVNQLLGGDVVRLEMRCVRVREGVRFRVDFKVKSMQLVVAIPRNVDVRY